MIGASDRILAATPAEAGQLVGLYRAEPEHIRLVPPGVDHTDVHAARSRGRAEPALPVGAPAGAVRRAAAGAQGPRRRDPHDRRRDRARARDARATSSSRSSAARAAHEVGELDRLMDLTTSLGVADRVMFFPPQPQERLADFYAAADVVLVPSRSESFGLVALEAQACGTPVVAARVGGLPFVVDDGATGFLVDGHDPEGARRARARRAARRRAASALRRGGRVPRAAVHVGRHRRRGRARLPRRRSPA